MKLLIISQYYLPDITAAAFRVGETAEILARKGHHVTVVTSEPHRAPISALRPPSRSVGTAEAEETGQPIRPVVYRVPIDPLNAGGMRAYLRHFFSFVLRARRKVRRLLRDGYRPDVIWTTSPPLFVGLAGTGAARWSGAPLVLDIRDVWPDTAVAAGQISRDGRAYRFGRKLERWLYRKADAMTCVALPMAEYLRKESPAATSVTVVYNGAGFEPETAVGTEEIRKTVLYAGNLGRLQGVDILLDAWAQLTDQERRGWIVEIIGGGVLENELRDAARKHQINTSVEFRGVLSKEETIFEMRRAGALFLNLIPSPVFDLTIPSKLFDYLATGRPIIAGITGEGASVLSSLPGNHVIPPSDISAATDAIRGVIGRERWHDGLSENRTTASRRFSRRANADVLEEMLLRRARQYE